MQNDHPILTDDPLQRDAKLRKLLGLKDYEAIPAGLISSLTAQASLPTDDATRDLQLANVARKMNRSGMTGDNNLAAKMLNDKESREGSEIFSDEMLRPEEVLEAPHGAGYMMANWGLRWTLQGVQAIRSAVATPRAVEELEALGTGLLFGAAEMGVSKLDEISTAFGGEGFKEDVDMLREISKGQLSGTEPNLAHKIATLQDFEATVGVPLENEAQYIHGVMAANEREMAGTTGTMRWLGRGAGNLGMTLVDFAGASTLGFLAGGPAGSAAALDIMFLNIANAHAWDVYDETGDSTQAIFSGVLNFGVTKFVMGMGHKAIGTARQQINQIVPKLTISQTGRIAAHLERGEINPIMVILKTHGAFAANTVAAREVEWGLNMAYQEHFAVGHHASRYKISMDNILAVAGHALEEWAVLSMLPMVTQSAGRGASFLPIAGLSKAKSIAAFDYWTNGLHSFSEMLHKTSNKELQSVRERYVAEVGENPSNPVQKLQLELIDNVIANRTSTVLKPGEAPRVSKLNDIAKEIGSESNHAKRFTMWDEATRAQENIFGKFEQSNKADVTVEVDSAVEAARHVTKEEQRQTHSKEAEAEVAKQEAAKKPAKEKEPTPSEKEAIGKPREKDVDELALDMLFNDPKNKASEAYKAEIKELRNRDNLTKEEKAHLEKLEEAVETADILKGRQKDTDVEFGETGTLRASQLEEKINSRNRAIKLKNQIESFVSDTVVKLKAKAKGAAETELTSIWGDFISKVESTFGESNPDIVASIKKTVNFNKKDKDGNAIFTDPAKLESAIGRAKTKLEKLSDVKDGTKSMLGWRTTKAGSRLTPLLDDVVTSIKKAVDKTWAKGGDYKKTIEDYFIKKGEHFNETKEESIEASKEITKLVEKVEKADGDFSVLDAAESAKLESFVKELYDASNAGLEIKMARAEAEVVLYDNMITREILNARLTDGKKSDWDAASNTTFIDGVKAIAHGMKENGRLQDYAEYISGGNSTVTHKILYENVLTGYKEARRAESKLHFMLEDIYTREFKLTDAEVASVTGNQGKNTRGHKKFEAAVTINHKGKTIELASHEVVHILMQAADSTTLELWAGKNSGIKVKGLHDSIRGKEQAKVIQQVIDQAGDVETRVAAANVRFVNSPQVKQMVRDVGIRIKGKDILEDRAPGDNFMFRQRLMENEVSIKEAPSANSLFDAMKSESGMGDILDSSVRTSILESRTTTAKYDIVVGDGIQMLNNWIHSLTVLRHLEKPLTLAQNVVKGKEFSGQKDAMGRAVGKGQKVDRLSAKLMGDMDKNFYRPLIQSEMGYMKTSNDIMTKWFRKARGVTQTAKLGLKPAVILYQGLSLIPAARHMGPGGKRAIMQALYESTYGMAGKNKVLHDKAMRNSGLYWERTVVGNAAAITSGTTSQSSFTSALAGGKQVKSTNRNKRDQIKHAAQASMSGISGMDQKTVRVLYRATEIHLKNRWDAQGKKIEGNEALFDEIVRREFEYNLTESQPFYNALTQPANINKGASSTMWGALTMFRGLTGKLTAQQRLGFLRASRANRMGNHREAMGHLAEAAHMTLITATLVPLVRRATNVSLAYGAGNLIDSVFDTELGVEWTDAKAEALEDVWFDVLGGYTSMTPAGSMFTSGVLNRVSSAAGLTEGYKYQGDFSPVISTVQQALEMDFTVTQTPKQLLNNFKALSGILGLPEELFSIMKRTMRLQENTIRRQREQAAGKLFRRN